MSDGRTYWYSEDASFVHRERIVALGDELGAAVLAAMFVLRGEAKHQNDGGWVVSGVTKISHAGFIRDPELTRRIVERAAQLGELDDLEWLDDLRFKCRISGWGGDQERGATARRVAKHRAESNGLKRSVTGRNEDRTEQDRTEKDDSLRSSNSEDEISELFAYWQQQCGHPHAMLSPERRRKIAGRLREGITPQQIREAIDGAALGAVEKGKKRFDDIELICRSASKLESFIGREGSPASDVASERRESPSELLRAMEATG